jgi:hypothetical protein
MPYDITIRDLNILNPKNKLFPKNRADWCGDVDPAFWWCAESNKGRKQDIHHKHRKNMSQTNSPVPENNPRQQSSVLPII